MSTDSSRGPTMASKCPHAEQLACVGPKWTNIIFTAAGMLIIHAMRVNLSTTILTQYSAIRTSVKPSDYLPSLEWDAVQTSFLHSIFYIGFTITQIPAGIYVRHLPTRRLFGASILLSCCLNLLLPVTISHGAYWITLFIRIIQGLSEGFVWPLAYQIVYLCRGGPSETRMAAAVVSSSYAGPILGLPLAGVLIRYHGWEYVFYSCGCLGILWYACWIVFVREESFSSGSDTKDDVISSVPARAIFTSWPFISVCICHFAKGWVFYLLLNELPAYLNTFGVGPASNGMLSSLPFLFKVFFSYLSGVLADAMSSRYSLPVTTTRKFFTGLGFGTEALCLFLLLLLFDETWSITVLTIGIGIGGLATAGWNVNHLDLSPNFAPFLISVSNTFGNVAGFVSPLVVGRFIRDSAEFTQLNLFNEVDLTADSPEIFGWHAAFLVASGMMMSAAVIFLMCGSGELQPWDSVSELSPIVSSPKDRSVATKGGPTECNPFTLSPPNDTSAANNFAYVEDNHSLVARETTKLSVRQADRKPKLITPTGHENLAFESSDEVFTS